MKIKDLLCNCLNHFPVSVTQTKSMEIAECYICKHFIFRHRPKQVYKLIPNMYKWEVVQ